MAGQNANVNVTFTSSGAGSVAGDAAMVQEAIDSIHGKTVGVAYESNGASGAVREARAFDQAMKSGQASAAGVGRETERATKATAGMGKEAKNARSHMQGLRDDVRAVAAGAAAAGTRMGITSGAREAQRELTGANRAIGALEAGASRTAVATQTFASSAKSGGSSIRDAVIDVQKLSDGTWGVAEAMKAIGSRDLRHGGPNDPWAASGGTAKSSGPPPSTPPRGGGSAAGGGSVPTWEDILRERDAQPKESPRQSGPSPRSPYAERLAASRAAAAAAAASTAAASESIDKEGKSAQRASEHTMSLGHAFGMVQNAGWQMAMVGGMMAGVAGEAMSLGKSTAALGMNFDGMNNMIDRTMQRTARGQGLGLAQMDSELRESARSTAQALGPAMKASVGAVSSLEKAKMGAWGALGGNIEQFANTLSGNAPQIQSLMTSMGSSVLALGGDIVNGVAQSAPAWQQMSQNIGGASGPLTQGAKLFSEAIPKTASSVASDPAGSLGADVAGWADKVANWQPSFLGGKAFSMLSAHPRGTQDFSPAARGGGGGAAAPVKPGGFDPSKPFSGILPDGTPGTGDGKAAKPAKTGGYRPSPDAARYSGMSTREIYSSQYEAATGAAPGQPRYSGLGPRGGGSGVGAMPASIASGLGLAGGSAMPSLMSSMQSAVAGGGGGLAQATQQHIQKAVHTAGPAATAGGASLGAAMTGGMAQGVTSTQTVTDTVLIKHAKRMIDVSAGALGVHSPSLEYDYLGRMLPRGLAQGVERESSHAYGAIGGMLSGAQSMASKFSPDYQGVRGPTITMRKKSKTQANFNDPQAAKEAAAPPVAQQQMSAMQYSPAVMDRIQAHNDRAAQLRQGIADRHELAKNGWDVNPFVQGGQDAAAGVAEGMKQNAMLPAGAMVDISGYAQNAWRKDNGINSPSTVYAGFGSDQAAGVGVGFAAGAPAATSVMSAAAAGMSMALQGPLDDYGLQAGYTWVQGFADGVSRQIKTADFSALGEPDNLSPDAMRNLAGTGLLRAGSGASTWKTNSGGLGVVTLGGPSTLTINVPGHDVVIGDQVVASIADRQIEVALNDLTNASGTNL